MNTIVVKANNKITKALIAIFEAFGVSFELKKESSKLEKPYDKDFVNMVLKSSKDKESLVLTEDYKNQLFSEL